MSRVHWPASLIACVLVVLVGLLAAACAGDETTTSAASVSTTAATGGGTASPDTTIYAPAELPPAGDPVTGGVAKIASLQQPARFGYPPMVIGPDQWFEGLFLDTLFGPTNKPDEYEPLLAERWELTPDKSAYIFYLRQGVKFTDGTDFNAQACKFCWDLSIDAAAAGPSAGGPPGAPAGDAGAPPPAGGEAGGPPPGPPGPPPDFAFVESIEVIDDYTVKVNLKEWSNQVLPFIGRLSWAVFSPTAYEQMGADELAVNPVGTGAWKLKSFQPNQSMALEKNPDYWRKDAQGRQLPYMDGVEITFFQDPTTELMALKAGQVDAAAQVSPVAAAELQTNPDFILAGFAGPVDMITMNTVDPDSVWSDVRMRQALEYAIDKEGIAKSVGLGFSPPIYTVLHSVDNYLDPGTMPRKYDPAKAKQLMVEAGHTSAETSLVFSSTNVNQDMVVAIQANLAAVGINATLNGMSSAAFAPIGTAVPVGNDLIFNGERGGGPNVLQGAIEMFGKGTIYFPGAEFPDKFYTLMDQAQQVDTLGETYPMVAEMEQIAYEDATVVPVLGANFVAVSGPKFKHMNWYYGGTPHPWFQEAWLQP